MEQNIIVKFLGAASVILGFGAYKEYGLISKSIIREEA